MNLRLRRFLAPVMRMTAPGCTACRHCGWPWTRVSGHEISYQQDARSRKGIITACISCWPLLTPEEKMRYASELVNGTGVGWRRNQPWDLEASRLALRAVAREAGAETDEDIQRLLDRAFPTEITWKLIEKIL